MKITGIKTYICDAFRANWVFVKVQTDEGLHGIGEATLEMSETVVAAAVADIERYVIGRDPGDIEAIWQDVYRDNYWKGGAVFMSALAGIEIALWDLKGRALGVPVYQLLGGKVRDKVACYANGWFAGARTPEEFAGKAGDAIALGFKGLKWDPFGSAYMNLTPAEFRTAFDCIEAVAAAVGRRAELLIEGHGRFNVTTAIRVGRQLEKFDNILWFEEPVPPESREAMREVRVRVRVPIASGERIYTRFEYREFLTERCSDFIQPDVSHVGGLGELRKIASMAESFLVPVCPHNPIGPVANAATLQLAACTPNFLLLETMMTDVPHRRQVTTEQVSFADGFMGIPNRPGLGIDLVEDEISKHPYKPYKLRHYTGTLTDIRPAGATAFYK
jgi:galactonate dehydratase